MPDNITTGWRKKITSKPKEFQPPRLNIIDTTTADDSSEKRRHHGWRMTIQASRPSTPVSAPPVTPTLEEPVEARGERSAPLTPRRDSRPKLNRYTSLFSSFKDTPKGPLFDEPWNNTQPPPEPYTDPELAIQSIRSHMVSFSMKPIPLEHNSNLFRIFEAFHKMTGDKERLEVELQKARQDIERNEQDWFNQEQQYGEEIRRLELLMAQGTKGVEGVLQARQGTVVNRKRMHRSTISNSQPSTLTKFMTPAQIDAEIQSRSQKVLLQRPASPSTKMAALSRRFPGKADADLEIGTPPDKRDQTSTLTRKVQSELDLNRLGRRQSITISTGRSSIASGFSDGSGDPLPDEISSSRVIPKLDCDAFIALRELGSLVARRRGIDADRYVEGIMELLSGDATDEDYLGKIEPTEELQHHSTTVIEVEKLEQSTTVPQQHLRRFQSQPQLSQLSNNPKRRRHFSFEPGEDQLHALREEYLPASSQRDGGSTGRTLANLADVAGADVELPPENAGLQFAAPNHDADNGTKIPSPVHAFGSMRRKASISSMHSVPARVNDGRYDSQSSISQASILTAFRDNQMDSLRPGSIASSRSSSYKNQGSAEVSPSSKDGTKGIGVRNSVAQLTTEHANHTAVPQRNSHAKSITKPSTAGLLFRAPGKTGKPTCKENEAHGRLC
ncbi:hypothetical protein BDU57DRAFT_464605 [Ampelomyces quisqualis]|uniref:Uncharacterized protein n=1 Tax=Ampelomyces quisqualis TaxID=50730 RepID=A0A6A5R055_AMPQU|nr:hypothetical protein BDU57DRAFT_464605 [Ampelomyces quisqualis]